MSIHAASLPYLNHQDSRLFVGSADDFADIQKWYIQIYTMIYTIMFEVQRYLGSQSRQNSITWICCRAAMTESPGIFRHAQFPRLSDCVFTALAIGWFSRLPQFNQALRCSEPLSHSELSVCLVAPCNSPGASSNPHVVSAASSAASPLAACSAPPQPSVNSSGRYVPQPMLRCLGCNSLFTAWYTHHVPISRTIRSVK